MTIKTDVSEFNIINVRIIDTELKTIYIEEKPKGLIILISSKILDTANNIKLLEGFKVIRENEDRFIELIGYDIKLRLEICTKLNIERKLMFIEEIENNNYRLTFSSSFINNISNLEEIKIK